MIKWPCPDTVGDKELIGRRLLELPYTDEYGIFLKVNHFIDTRIEEDLSVDRLGETGSVNKKALRHLSRLSFRHAEINSNSFFGWCTCRVGYLKTFPYVVIASPDRTENDEKFWNHYHADISRSDHRNKRRAYELATALTHIFTSQTQDACGNKPMILEPIV